MFYDHFDELPDVIDDPNQQIYYTLTSLGDSAPASESDVKVDRLGRICTVKYIFCNSCGFALLAGHEALFRLRERKTDASVVVDFSGSPDFALNNLARGREVAVGSADAAEIRRLITCNKCEAIVGYALEASSGNIYFCRKFVTHSRRTARLARCLAAVSREARP